MNNIEIPNSSNVSLYSDVQDTEGRAVSLSVVLKDIKQGKWKKKIDELRAIQDEKKQKAYKNTLPCFTCSGVFKTRNREEMIAHTNVLTMDIDLKDNPILSEKFDEIRQKLIADKYTHFLFTSCRGNGLAVGVRIDGEKHLETFQYFEHYYREKHGLTIDRGCKDVTRLRFISYDPDLYSNEGAEIVIVPPEFLKEQKCSHSPVSHANGKNHEIVKAIIATGKLLGDDSYESWLRIAFALVQEFGETGRGYFHSLSGISPKYDPVDCDRKFDNCLKTNRGVVTFATIVHLAKEAGVRGASLWTPKECNETAGFDITKALKIGAELQVLDLPVNWAVKGLLPQQAITLLSARGGMGKTILSISIADAVTKGIPFLGLETTKMPVVYIDFENSLPTLIERIRRIDASNVLFWHPTNEIKPPRLDSK